MRGLVLALAILFLMGAGTWAYRQNYATRDVFQESRALQSEIAQAQQRLGVLRAEWAYLNRPDRLRDLAELNFDRLELLPLRPDQFARVADLAPPPLLDPEDDGLARAYDASSVSESRP